MDRIALSLIVVALLGLAPHAAAARRAPDPEHVQALVDAAAVHFKGGRYEDALSRYRQARDAGGPRVLDYMIGRCQQELERWEEARVSFRRYLAGGDLDPEAKVRAELALQAVEDRLSRGMLVVQVVPFGARIFLDGAPVGEAPLEPLEVAPGDHLLRVAHRGYRPDSRKVAVPAGGRVQVAVELTAGPATAEPEPEPEPGQEPEPAPRRSSTYSPWTWITLGTGLALAAGGTISYLYGVEDHTTVSNSAGYGTDGVVQMTRARALDLESSGDTKKLAGYVLWGFGGAAVVTSTVLFVLDATDDGATDRSVLVGAAPAPGGAVLSLGGSF